jgi:hypothetical protein
MLTIASDPSGHFAMAIGCRRQGDLAGAERHLFGEGFNESGGFCAELARLGPLGNSFGQMFQTKWLELNASALRDQAAFAAFSPDEWVDYEDAAFNLGYSMIVDPILHLVHTVDRWIGSCSSSSP